jgi:hypothetical protein
LSQTQGLAPRAQVCKKTKVVLMILQGVATPLAVTQY